MNKSVRQIRKMFEPGYDTVPMASGHHSVVFVSTGIPVRDNSGKPVTLPSSPARSERMNIIKRLEQVGVISRRVVRNQPKSTERGSSRLRLVRDDVAAPNTVNETETNLLRDQLDCLKVWSVPFSYLSGALAFVAGDTDQEMSDQLWSRMRLGWTLVPADREPFELFLAALEAADDPILEIYELYRDFKGIPRKYPEHKEEVVVSTTETDISKLSGPFMEQLQSRETELESTIEQIQNELEKISAFKEMFSEMLDSLGAGSATPMESLELQLSPGHQKETVTPTGGGSEGGSGEPATSRRPMIEEVLKRGGEWTSKEIQEETSSQQSVVDRHLRAMLEEGVIFVITPGSGPNPTTYGHSDHYEAD